jgi:2-polyprenyl-6-methoxyphenol hydroxylase-like FAD-dependent oxidoreductase
VKTVETLVVGAGPVGLFVAAELHRRGRSCLLIERAPAPSTHSKALAVMPGTMELFERSGVAGAFVNAANRIDGVRFVTARSSAYVPFHVIDSPYNYVSILPQWKTEQLLAEHLRTFGGDVRYAHELTALEPMDEGVSATVRAPQGIERIYARYVIGCDGVHSMVREQAGISFDGDSYPGTALLADAFIDTAVPANEARVHVNAHGVVTMFPMDARLRRIVVIAPGEQLPDRAERDWLQARLRNAGYAHAEIDHVAWSNAFRVHRRVASAMRRDNVFLAGDSVHTHSPVGGQGMNIGLHDASTLVSKLANVLEGAASVESLDAYERERLPVARAVVRRTDLLTRALVHPNPLLRVTRERIAPRIAGLPLVYRRMLRRLSLTA